MREEMPLADFHRAHGAIFQNDRGSRVVESFGDPAAEYRAVRSAAGLIDLSHRGLLQFTGPDRSSFLQGMLSNDLRALKPFQGQRAALLTQQGKVVADVRVLCSLNSFYLDFWAELTLKVLDHLNRYLVADEVEIADRSDDYATISLQGPQSGTVLRRLSDSIELPEEAHHHAMATIQDTAVCLVRGSDTGEPGYDLIVPVSKLLVIAEALTAAVTSLQGGWVGERAHDVLRVEAGVPRYGVDFDEDNLLLETGLVDAVSFTKGCYLGQEVVERIRSRGHVNKKLVGFRLGAAEPASRGDPVFAGDRQAGHITSSVRSPALDETIALGYAHKEFWQPGSAITVRHNGVSIPGTVVDLPFLPARASS